MRNSNWKHDYIKEHWFEDTIVDIAKKTKLSFNGVIHIANNILKLPQKSKIVSEHTALQKECELVGIPTEDVKHYWHKGKHFSIFAKNQETDFEEIKNSLIEDVKKYAPKYPTLKRPKLKDKTLFIIDPCDPHFGKYSTKQETGEDYNFEIANKRYIDGVNGVLNKGSFYQNEKIVIIGGNDVSHIDNPFRTTTAGTKQDTDGMWYEAFNAAKWANIKAIELALQVSDVHFVHCPSNHDYQTGFFLAQLIQAWFRNNKNVTFDVSPNHRKYIHYGLNLIGTTHGDGAKELDLPNLMTVEAKKAWSESSYGYWFLHHRHHKDKSIKDGRKHIQLEKDGKGCTVINTGLDLASKDKFHIEYLRSITSADGWHSRNGFQHSFQGMEGFIHHPIMGQINRITHLF